MRKSTVPEPRMTGDEDSHRHRRQPKWRRLLRRVAQRLGQVYWILSLPLIFFIGWLRRTGTIGKYLLWLLSMPFYLVALAWHRIGRGRKKRGSTHWIDQLQPKYLLQGVPALLVFAAALTVCVIWAVRRDSRLIDRYSGEGGAAFQEEDYHKAMICYTRLVQLDPGRDSFRFLLALTAQQNGEAKRAEAMMEKLAPRDRLGHVPAHLWRAQQALAKQPISVEAFRAAEAHLLRVLENQRTNEKARTALVQMYASVGRLDDVLRHYPRLINKDSKLRLQIARLHNDRRDTKSARAEVELIMDGFRRRAEDDLDDHESRLSWADCLVIMGEHAAAGEVLRDGYTLTPDATYGIPLARFYLQWADELATEGKSPAARLRLVQEAAALLEKHGTDTADAHELQARLQVALGNADEAEQHLKQAAADRPQLQLEIARLRAMRGQPEEARKIATKALALYQAELEKEPHSDEFRLLAARASLLLGDFELTVKLLHEGWQRTQYAGYSKALSRAYVAWWDASRQAAGPQSTGHSLEMLRAAMNYDTWNPDVVQRLLKVARESDTAAEAARTMLRDMLAQGEAPATVHVLLGTDAIEQGQMDLGRRHLEQAYETAPRAVEVANNLAWALAHSDPPDLPRALSLINTALDQMPDHANLLDTRGRILAKMQRWKQALFDLEKCLPTMRGRKDFHLVIAEVYENVGMPDLAAEHARLAAAGDRAEDGPVDSATPTPPKSDDPGTGVLPQTPGPASGKTP